jgi:hypothetical protein
MIGFLLPILGILAGAAAAASFIAGKMPKMKDNLEKLKIYQAGIGAAAAVVGLLSLVDYIPKPHNLSASTWLIALAVCFSLLLVGFVLGYPVLQSLILDDMSEENRNKAENIKNKLAPFQILCGLICLGGGIMLLMAKLFGMK